MTTIIKASGKRVPFKEENLRRSLARVGTSEQLINKITQEVKNCLEDGMTTHKIYQLAFKLLRKESKLLGSKYHLKRAIMQLGSSGYPFERYVAELFRQQGYFAENNQIIQGRCVTHEVDVVAERDNEKYFIECKYHNRGGLKCDVKVSLYFRARMLDISEQPDNHNHSATKVIGLLATNTRFSKDAMQYGRCTGLKLMGWDYPQVGSLKELIEVSGLYPITCIGNLTKGEISQLLSKQIVLCRSLMSNTHLLDKLKIPKLRKESILAQCHSLCGN